MRSLPAWIDNEISLLSKQDFVGWGGIDLKNNVSVGEALDQMACADADCWRSQPIKDLLEVE